jgi:hypothetical protein
MENCFIISCIIFKKEYKKMGYWHRLETNVYHKKLKQYIKCKKKTVTNVKNKKEIKKLLSL